MLEAPGDIELFTGKARLSYLDKVQSPIDVVAENTSVDRLYIVGQHTDKTKELHEIEEALRKLHTEVDPEGGQLTGVAVVNQKPFVFVCEGPTEALITVLSGLSIYNATKIESSKVLSYHMKTACQDKQYGASIGTEETVKDQVDLKMRLADVIDCDIVEIEKGMERVWSQFVRK
eukprot:Clim_evm25s25 gene=Clim_evmTU25s25